MIIVLIYKRDDKRLIWLLEWEFVIGCFIEVDGVEGGEGGWEVWFDAVEVGVGGEIGEDDVFAVAIFDVVFHPIGDIFSSCHVPVGESSEVH